MQRSANAQACHACYGCMRFGCEESADELPVLAVSAPLMRMDAQASGMKSKPGALARGSCS
jgi:hypothetical protein